MLVAADWILAVKKGKSSHATGRRLAHNPDFPLRRFIRCECGHGNRQVDCIHMLIHAVTVDKTVHGIWRRGGNRSIRRGRAQHLNCYVFALMGRICRQFRIGAGQVIHRIIHAQQRILHSSLKAINIRPTTVFWQAQITEKMVERAIFHHDHNDRVELIQICHKHVLCSFFLSLHLTLRECKARH